MVTLLERLTPLLKESRRTVCLVSLYYLTKDPSTSVTASALKQELIDARVPNAKKFNVADVLGKAGELASATSGGSQLIWTLTGSGRDYVASFIEIDDESVGVKNAAQDLVMITKSIVDEVTRGYIEEAVLCLQVDARRAAVVFLWSGAIRTLQELAWAKGARQVNSAISVHDSRAKALKKPEDFSAIKDVTQLLVFRERGLLDKGQWQTLQEGLDLRNRCGHPTRYHPGVSKVAAFVEDVVGIVF